MKKILFPALLALCTLMTACTTTEKVESYNIATGAHQCFAAVGDNLISATASGVRVYGINGEILLDKTANLSYPEICENADSAAVYDVGGVLVVFSDGSKIYADDSIISADLNSSGYLALCCEKDGYKGAVTVYSPEKAKLFEWCSADNWVLGASMSDDGEHLAVLLSGENGSSVRFFAISSEDELGCFEGTQSVINSLCRVEEVLCCVADDGLYYLSDEGKLTAEYSFEGQKLGMLAVCENELVIELRNHSFGGAGTLIAVNSQGKQTAKTEPNAELEWIDYADGTILALTQNKTLVYDTELKLQSETAQSGTEKAFLRTDDMILISGGTVNVTDIK